MREKADPHGADLPRNESGLGRPPGPHGDIGVAPKEVLNPVAHCKLDRDGRVSNAKARKDWRQGLAPHDLTRCHPHASTNNACFTGRRAPEGGLRDRHCLGMGNEFDRSARRQ
jgi:hypothetical protein